MSQLRQKSSLLFLVIGGLVVGILLLEIGVRLFIPPVGQFRNLGAPFVYSSTLGWRGDSNFDGIITHPEFERRLILNKQGMHDTDHAFTKPSGTTRLLLVGDSFTEAIQVAEKETAHQRLEDLLNQRVGKGDHHFEVISGAVSGWGTGQELLYYRQEGRRYQPDVVLLMLYIGNDIQDNLPGHAITIDGFNRFAPYFPVCQGQMAVDPWAYIPGLAPAWNECPKWLYTVTSLLDIIQDYSYLFAQLEPLLLAKTEIRQIGEMFDFPYTPLYMPQPDETIEYGWQVTEGLIQQFEREVAADGAKFGVVFFGPREIIWLSLFDEGQVQQLYDTNPYLKEAQADYPNRRLMEFLMAHDIPGLDLQPGLRDYIAATGVELYLPIDHHWNTEGNRVVAEMIFGWLMVEERLRLKE